MTLGTWPEFLDLKRTFAFLRCGSLDPTSGLTNQTFRKAFRSPQGPCTLTFFSDRLEADGPGSQWCAQHLGPTLRFQDPPGWPEPLRDLARPLRGLRLIRIPWVNDIAMTIILQQRVTFQEAAESYRRIVQDHGDPCGDLHLPLSRPQWLGLSTARLAFYGIDGKRATTLLRTADHSKKLERLYPADFQEVRRLLDHLPGIGPWTREMLLGYGWGDPDAVPTGDVHLPHIVAQRLAGLPYGDDDLMLKLLEPYRGRRFQVIRWLLSPKEAKSA